MGWWQLEGDMVNGDTPADIMGPAVDKIIKESNLFIRYEKNDRITKNYSTITRNYTTFLKWDIEPLILDECAKKLFGEHDFTLLSKASSDVHNKICIIFESEWIVSNSDICFKITANRFLQHMVRLLVGTMIEVARGRIPVKEFEKMLNNKEINFSSVRAPAAGLFLNKIFYDE